MTLEEFNERLRTKGNRRYRKAKKDTCERCAFVAEHPCQLDVDHIDGDHSNNRPSNLQTLCANCHRLKSYNDKMARSQSP